MNLTTDRSQGVAVVRVNEARLMYPLLSEFANTVTTKLLTYALGRGVEYYDGPAVRKIMRDAGSGNYKWSSLVLGIVKSAPFQMRRSRES